MLNKIDLPSANPEKYAAELAGIIGCDPGDVLQVSAKTGVGVRELLDQIVAQTPAPVGDPDAPPRALIFDSVYDTYRGVVTYVRVVDGKLSHRDRIKMMSTGAVHEMLEVGVISPEPVKAGDLGVGEVGYLITGVKDVRQSRVGDTVTSQHHGATEALGGYKHPNPMVLRRALPDRRRRLPDAARRPGASCSSTTPRWPTSRRPRAPSASGSAAASSACCTWRSSASGSSASSTST